MLRGEIDIAAMIDGHRDVIAAKRNISIQRLQRHQSESDEFENKEWDRDEQVEEILLSIINHPWLHIGIPISV